MARELILNLNKNKSTFGISKIDRKKLYGFKKRLFLDEKGKECSKANLEEETGIVFVSSDISSSYLDHKGNFVEKKELEAINDEGKKVNNVFWLAREPLAQFRVLGGNTHWTSV